MLCRLWKGRHTCVEPNVLVEAAQELLKSGEEILRQRVNALVRTKALVLSPQREIYSFRLPHIRN